MGLLLRVLVHPADVQDRDSARRLLRRLRDEFPRLAKLWADRGYEGDLVAWAARELGVELEIVRRQDGERGFVVLPRRWAVERSFAWYGRSRRLSKDYEYFPSSGESWVYLASIHLLLQRLARSPDNDAKAA